jgi:Zn-finger nucleic acid-binding protein
MTEPNGAPALTCPACQQPLRTYHARLVCDACSGMFITLADLAGTIHEMTSIGPTFALVREHAGTRACPRCQAAMSTCKLEIKLDADIEHPKPELDHCAAHGVWFDDDELALVLEKVATKGFGGDVGRKGGWRGAADQAGAADQGGGLPDAFVGGKRFGGHGFL